MGIVSYAQNFEDVLLNRVFASVHYAFYVDIGAYNPTEDSVTKSFYDRGWDGINIEPGEIFEQLAAARSRDINLKMAVYDHTGTISFVQHPGWYAGLSHVQAEPLEQSEAPASQAVEVRTVSCDTLTNILAKYGSQRPIAFLKIDVEGAEEAIIRSTDWRAIRPTVLLIEATKPRSTVLDNQHWEPVLLEQGYQRAYFDGINCYYVPDERADLLRHFEMPVNVLDGFQRFDPRLEDVRAQAASAETQLAEARAELTRSHAQRDLERAQNTELKQTLHDAEAGLAQLKQTLHDAEAGLAAARQTLESVPAAQTTAVTAAVSAVVEANTYQLADLHRQRGDLHRRLADMETHIGNLQRERDALLGVRDQAMRLRRLMRELRWPDGPGALRAVLPLARFLRTFAGTKLPPMPPEDYASLAPAAPGSPLAIAVTPTGSANPPRRSIGKRAVRLVYRPFRPLGRPAALRLRAFLTTQVHTEFMQLDGKLSQIRDDLARAAAAQPSHLVHAVDPRLTELQLEVRQFGKLLEDTLLTITMESMEPRHGAGQSLD